MFWGIVLKPNKKYTQVVKKSFHLSQASLDLTNCGDNAQVQVFVTTTEVKVLLATLSKIHSHVAVDLVFSEGESISFHTQGGATSVHLAGYFLDDEDDFDGLGEEIDSDEEVPQLVEASKMKKGKKVQDVAAVKAENEDDSSEDDTFEMGEEEDGSGDEEEEDNDDDDDGEEEDEDDDDSEDEDEEEEEVKEPKAKQLKLDGPKQNGIENGQKATKQEKKQQQQQQQKQQQQQQSKKGGERTLSGNVKVEDVVVGKGDEATSGKKVQVFYEGRLKSNNKVFDSSKQGNGFKFKLGQGEVIKGWDVGVIGMKVGGKRRITCPPHMAYGARGSPPVIPPNSTLVFEVELKRVL